MARTAAVFAAAVALVAATLSARAEPVANACGRTYAPQTLDYSQPLNLGQLKQQIYYYACSGAYDRDLNQVLDEAKRYVEARGAQVSKPAIVLDIDETSLSNLPIELVDDFAFLTDIPCEPDLKAPCGFNNWVALARAKRIDGTYALFNAAKARGAAVFFITGRHQSQEAVTVTNLNAVGYEGWTGISLRPEHDKRTVIEYKSSERAKIAAQGYTIIVNVGDQHSDLAGGYAERAYKLPNPFYYIP